MTMHAFDIRARCQREVALLSSDEYETFRPSSGPYFCRKRLFVHPDGYIVWTPRSGKMLVRELHAGGCAAAGRHRPALG